jgi:hypothetical protein
MRVNTTDGGAGGANDEYAEMELLERLEALREEMEDLGVKTLEEVGARIDEMHRQIEARH